MTAFTNAGGGKQRVAFSAPFPGKILPMDLAALGGELICQKDAFLCAAKGVSIGIAFQRRLGAGLFGGEGFIMERLQGDGLAFVHAGGTLAEGPWGRAKPFGWIPAAWSPCRREFPTTSSSWAASRPPCSAARDSFSRPSPAPARSGSSPCLSADWPTGSSPLLRGPAGSAKERGRSWGPLGVCSTGTISESRGDGEMDTVLPFLPSLAQNAHPVGANLVFAQVCVRSWSCLHPRGMTSIVPTESPPFSRISIRPPFRFGSISFREGMRPLPGMRR